MWLQGPWGFRGERGSKGEKGDEVRLCNREQRGLQRLNWHMVDFYAGQSQASRIQNRQQDETIQNRLLRIWFEWLRKRSSNVKVSIRFILGIFSSSGRWTLTFFCCCGVHIFLGFLQGFIGVKGRTGDIGQTGEKVLSHWRTALIVIITYYIATATACHCHYCQHHHYHHYSSSSWHRTYIL